MQNKLKIGTRGSKLALWQAHFFQDALKDLGYESEIQIIKTKGDQIQNLSFDKLEGKGFFTKELEDALLNHDVDLAIHSLKDMPTTQPNGLCLASVSYREDPSDVLIIRKEVMQEGRLLSLPANAIIGTSSARRKAQIKHLVSDCEIKDIRGNVPTRIQKLIDGHFDAILLAQAGINRLALDLSDLKTITLHPSEFVPAPGQGVMVSQCRIDDIPTRKILKELHQTDVGDCINVERKVLQMLDGGCQLPLGVFCSKDAMGNYHVQSALEKDGELRRFKTSQSTRLGLSETILNVLTNE